jgi:hypothetical protein
MGAVGLALCPCLEVGFFEICPKIAISKSPPTIWSLAYRSVYFTGKRFPNSAFELAFLTLAEGSVQPQAPNEHKICDEQGANSEFISFLLSTRQALEPQLHGGISRI